MSHSDTIKELPTNGVRLASTADVENAAYRIDGEDTYAIQFHPEVIIDRRKTIIRKIFVHIAGVKQDWIRLFVSSN